MKLIVVGWAILFVETNKLKEIQTRRIQKLKVCLEQGSSSFGAERFVYPYFKVDFFCDNNKEDPFKKDEGYITLSF